MKYQLERYELWARECKDEGVAAEHLEETCREIRRLRETIHKDRQAIEAISDTISCGCACQTCDESLRARLETEGQ